MKHPPRTIACLTATLIFVSLLSLPAAAQPTNSTLTGEYIVTTYFDDSVDGRSTSLSTVTLDGNGGGMWQTVASSINDTGTGVLTYEVNADATITMTVDGSPLRGIIDPSGEAITAVELDPGRVDLKVQNGIA